MAGGNKRGSYGPMSERVVGNTPAPAEPAPPPSLQHCWVTSKHGQLPGLLLGWRRRDTGEWEGHVAHAVLSSDGHWTLVEEWLPAGLLDPA